MSLYDDLQECNAEKEVEKAIEDFFGLSLYNASFQDGKVDIKTKDNLVWIEAKYGDKTESRALTQLLSYINKCLENGDKLPSFGITVDQKTFGLIEITNDLLDFIKNPLLAYYKNKDMSHSMPPKSSIDYVKNTFIDTAFFRSYKIRTEEEEILRVFEAISKNGKLLKQEITASNIVGFFNIWNDEIGIMLDIKNSTHKLIDIFFIDIFRNDDTGFLADVGRFSMQTIMGRPNIYFYLNGKTAEEFFVINDMTKYNQFWSKYIRPPRESDWEEIKSNRHVLVPLDTRKYQGAYFTPFKLVIKAYDYLSESLGSNWYKDYYIWDMACGTGNLLVNLPLKDFSNVFASSLVESELNILRSENKLPPQNIFQYDYLNDDIGDTGGIDYSITNKIPPRLQKIIKEEPYKLLVLINPPYGEAGEKVGISKNNISKSMRANSLGGGLRASNDLYILFFNRINIEIATCKLGAFSTLKHLVGEKSEIFREHFLSIFLKGYMVQADWFQAVSDGFPIGFLVYDTKAGKLDKCRLDILNKDLNKIGTKHIKAIDKNKTLNKWYNRPKANETFSLPLTSALNTKDAKEKSLKKACDYMLGYFHCGRGDVGSAKESTNILSSTYFDGHGSYITEDNLTKIFMMFTVRIIIKKTWYNKEDRFLLPRKTPSKEFENDCLIYTIFNGKNLTASANNLKYDNANHSIINHFIPFTENQLKTNSLATFIFESHFLIDYLRKNDILDNLSPEALAVYNEALKLWQLFFTNLDHFETNFELSTKYKLNRDEHDYGWYQVRMTLKDYLDTNHKATFSNFDIAYKNLSHKLTPLIYEYGFL